MDIHRASQLVCVLKARDIRATPHVTHVSIGSKHYFPVNCWAVRKGHGWILSSAVDGEDVGWFRTMREVITYMRLMGWI